MHIRKSESSGLIKFLKSYNISTKLPQSENFLPYRFDATAYNTAIRSNQSYAKHSKKSPQKTIRLARAVESTNKTKNNLVNLLKIISRLLTDTCLKNVVCEIESMLEQMQFQCLVGTFLALSMPLFPSSRMHYVHYAVGLVGDGCFSVQC